MTTRSRSILAAVCILLGMAMAVESLQHFSSWSAPVSLGTNVNGPGNDSGQFISRNGLTLYFNSTGFGGSGSLDILVSYRDSEDGEWGPPSNLGPNINSGANDNAPALSPDEHRMYFQSARSGGLGGGDIYVARRHNRRDDSAWQPAENLDSPVNSSANDQTPFYFEDEMTGAITLYFSSNRPGGLGAGDIYASTLQPDETWGTPVLVQELSSPYEDLQPFVRRDGLEMFLSSNRPGGLHMIDVWVSTRASTSEPWSTPVNIGPVVNSHAVTARPALSFDGTVLYLTASDSLPNFDLYASTRTKVKGKAKTDQQ